MMFSYIFLKKSKRLLPFVVRTCSLSSVNRSWENPPEVYQRFIQKIKDKEAFVVTGTGVSLSLTAGTESSKVVSWNGLLEAMKLKMKVFSDKDIANWPTGPDANPFLKAELLNQFALDNNFPVDYRQFVFEFLSNLSVNPIASLGTHNSIAEAISALRLPISTLNYDTLLEKCLHRFAKNARVKNCNESTNFVYHIHGLFYEANNIVLTENAETLEEFSVAIKNLVGLNDKKYSMIFIGCSGGAVDHHFDCLWKSTHPPLTAQDNFIILTQKALDSLRQDKIYGDNFRYAENKGILTPIVCGLTTADLVPFLWNVAVECGWRESPTRHTSIGLKKVIRLNEHNNEIETVFRSLSDNSDSNDHAS